MPHCSITDDNTPRRQLVRDYLQWTTPTPADQQDFVQRVLVPLYVHDTDSYVL